ncbi:putative RDD family membrane protein YckC [Aequitasia blattaphilus]|uniref:RDD family protein n=1 Tax=Aequitasia blattaphilus TaxID=2949332 RepID=A0ABT1E6N3_9FIRM|nr:RDD family protein [Aequitasia blattaphilus]MCP1101474.1 RDD family protein [Aequitasia blattaphilus]MCR8614114.1 RDD family protein [Aequitasia blattaphilus]
MQNNFNNFRGEPAGFFVRLGAYLIDLIIVNASLLIIRLMLLVFMSLLSDTPLSGNILFHFSLLDIILYLCKVLYFILLTYFTGTTLGKRAMNLRVIHKNSYQKISLMEVVFRETIGRFLSSIILYAGYLMIGIDKEKEALHDKLSDTKVVYNLVKEVNYETSGF